MKTILNRYHKVATKFAKETGKEITPIQEIETLIGTQTGFSYDKNLIFFADDTMLLQSKDEKDPNQIHEFSDYEIEEL